MKVDWISLNIKGLINPKIIENCFSKYFIPYVFIDDKLSVKSHELIKKYKVYIHQYTGVKGYWTGTKISFSGKNAHYFYGLLKTQNFDWSLLQVNNITVSLGRIDLCFSLLTGLSHTNKSFDTFLLNSRSYVQNNTSTKYIKLQDFPNGKMLKINRRNNSQHYRIYQKDESIRFELELKHRQAKGVQDYLFQSQFDAFEHHLVTHYFNYSSQILPLGYSYTSWIRHYKRKYLNSITSCSLLTSYLGSRLMKNHEEEERLFHLLQFLSFIKSLKLDLLDDYQVYKIKKQSYYGLRFPLNQFMKFIGIKSTSHYNREKLLLYFYQLQTLGPLVKIFSNMAFKSYVCFPYVECINPSGNSWLIEVLVAEELFYFAYPFRLTKSFLHSKSKNDLRLKIRLLKSLAVSSTKKKLDLEEFFNGINARNHSLIQIKKKLIQLLRELAENYIIQNEIEILLKSGKNKSYLIQNLTVSDITRRIKYIQYFERLHIN